MDLYAQVVHLLGKPEEHPALQQFIDRLGETPKIHDLGRVSFYQFVETGIEFVVQWDAPGAKKCIYAALFFIDVLSVRDGHIKPFRAALIDGVSPDDPLEVVKEKMTLEPTDWFADTVPELRYDFPDHILQFHFSKTLGGRMSLASVSRATDNQHFKGRLR